MTSIPRRSSAIALHVLPKRPEQAETALVASSQTSKQALDELRLTLAVLRRDDTVLPVTPVPCEQAGHVAA
jgi:predicted Zn-ribbon and HTH transcriptional regulator